MLGLSDPLMPTIREFRCCLAGFGITGTLRRHSQRALGGSVVLRLVLGKHINPGADLGAVGAALWLLILSPVLLYGTLVAGLSAGLQFLTRYARCVAVLNYLGPSLFARVICTFMANVLWTNAGLAIV